MSLTDTFVKSIKPNGSVQKYSDGGGLYLRVEPKGSKLWRMNYSFHKKQKTLSFGVYPAVGLADARRKRDDAKKLLASAIDPSHQLKLDKAKRGIQNASTFNAVADEFLQKVEREGRAPTTMKKKRWLVDLARPELGSRPIGEITSVEILMPLRNVESLGNYETARRLRSTIGQVFRYAIATGRVANDPTSGLKGALTAPIVSHHAALTEAKAFGGLLRAVWGYAGTNDTKAALQLLAYLYPRPGELRFAEWTEFDLPQATWTIPSSRTKMRREHKKPLPSQAVEILERQYQNTGDGKLVFPSIKSRLRPISENTFNGALRRLGFKTEEMTSHGFRASASSILNESGKWSPDAIEAELAHIGADQVRRAYHRSQYWDERKLMAQWWADEINRLRIDNANT